MIDGWTVALAVVLVLGALGVIALLRGIGFKASADVGTERTGFDFEIRPSQRDSAIESVRMASREKGNQRGLDEAIHSIETVQVAVNKQVLWVDDFPDNNVFEATVLQELGLNITTATSTWAALHYLKALDFHLVVTDMGRGDQPTAGIDLIREMRSHEHHHDVIVYTSDVHDARASAAWKVGAAGVFDAPGELILALLDRLAGS